MDNLQRELARRAERGAFPSTIKAIEAELRAIGYRLDRTMDCRGNARYMTGPAAGETYPSIDTGINQIDDGLRFCNVDARRDDNYKRLQDMRRSGEWFAVTRGAILEL